MVASNGFDFDELERLESRQPEKKEEPEKEIRRDEDVDANASDSNHDEEEEVEALEDGLFDYEVRSTVASGEPVKGLELPALCANEVLPTRQKKLSDTKGADGPESLREAGNSCFRAGDFTAAECLSIALVGDTVVTASLYSTALQTPGPGSPRLFSNRAAARLKLAKWDEALQDIMEATKKDPANPKVCRYLS
eukprot:symbB.v1.2.001075.t1/scaffold33.1/size517934/27